MRDVPIDDPPLEDLGPAMLGLTPMQRRFVIGWIKNMGLNAARIARAAGYEHAGAAVRAHNLLRNSKVIEALREEAERRLDSLAVLALLRLGNVVDNPKHRDHLKAVDSVLDRSGYGRQTQHRVRVEHTDTRSTAELLALVERYQASRALPAPIEGEFEEAAGEDSPGAL